MGTREMLRQLKKTIVFICIEHPDGTIKTKDASFQTVGTGFLVQVDGINHLVTAKHVVTERRGNKEYEKPVFILTNTKDGRVKVRSISALMREDKIQWVIHKNPGVDVAMIPLRLAAGEEDVITVPDKYFLDLKRLSELDNVFSLSFQPGAGDVTAVHPIIRTGTVSRINKDGTYFVDSSAFPGNSGSPVFTRPLPGELDKGSEEVKAGDAPPGGHFIGVIGAYLPYRDIAVSTQTGKPRVVFEENTGLCIVWSVHFLAEIMASEDFKKQLRHCKKLK